MKLLLKKLKSSPSMQGGLYFAFYFGMWGVVNPFMTLELTQRGFTGTEVGTIGSIRSFIILLLAPVLARIADRYGIRVKMLTVFLFIAGVATALFTLPETFPWLIVVTFLVAFGTAPIDSLGNSVTVRMANRHQLDYGKMTFWGAVAFTSMNLIGAIIWPVVGFRWIYISGGVMYLLVSLVSRSLEEPQDTAISNDLPKKSKTKRKLHLKPAIVVFLMVYFLYNFAFFNAFSFTAPILDSRGVSEFWIGFLGTIIGVGAMIVRLWSKDIYKRMPIELALIGAIITGILPMVVYGFFDNIILLMVVSVLRGAGWGLFSLSSIKYIDAQASVENASTLQSLVIMLSTFSGIISNPIAGMLYDTNINLIFYISIGVASLALLLMVVTYRMQVGSMPVTELEDAV